MISFTVGTEKVGYSGNIGHHDYRRENVAKGICPHCDHNCAFSQVGESRESSEHGDMVAIECDGCNSIFSVSIVDSEIFPKPTPERIDDIPNQVSEYYDEAIDCIGAGAPNAAAAMFRKVIEAVCEDYGVTDVSRNDDIYDLIEDMADEGYITEEHRKSLLALKDAGNDAVHLNDNDPNIEDAKQLKKLVESILTATVVAKYRMDQTRESFPNPHKD